MIRQLATNQGSMTGIGFGTLGAARRVLIIEDDSSIRTAVAELLEEEGFEVSTSEQGQAALSSLRDGRPLPDLIILDLMMPVMDGWDFRVKQRTDPLLADIPVVAISADCSPKARAIHADAYLSKPFSADELLLRLDQILRDREERLIRDRIGHTQRLAALGTLAVGIGHEINNALGAVTASIELANHALPRMQSSLETVRRGPLSPNADAAVSSLHEGLQMLEENTHDALLGAQRMLEIAASLRTFAQVPGRPTKTVDLKDIIEGALRVCGVQVSARAHVVLDLQAAPPVLGDAGQLSQVIVNLLVNAAQAFEHSRIADNEIQVSLSALHDHVFVEISDNGPGIPAVLQKRLFEPFFTTKPSGEGTGLGLFISRSILDAHGGVLSVSSEEGKGTTFRLEIPTPSHQDPPLETAPKRERPRE